MELHVFKCPTDESLYGFTKDLSGENLPGISCKGKWEFWATKTLEPNTPSMGNLINEIIDGVEALGYHIASDGIQISKLE
jgi:hypothetical protein